MFLGDKPIAIVIVLKAMGLESDQEIAQLVGSEPDMIELFAGSLEEPYNLGIYTQQQSLKYIGVKIKAKNDMFSMGGGGGDAANGGAGGASGMNRKYNNSPETEAIEILAHYVLNHVPVENYCFRSKVIYITHIVRRVLMTVKNPKLLDDKDYYGNKRLELAGSLVSLLFEDLFKRFNTILEKKLDKLLSSIKSSMTTSSSSISDIVSNDKNKQFKQLEVEKVMKDETITHGFVFAISTGNWALRRFRMDRAGVTQVLSRMSYISALGMMTRISSQFEKTRKVDYAITLLFVSLIAK